MTQTTAVNIPLEILISRFEENEKAMDHEILQCRWWQWKKIWMLRGAKSAYRIEADAAYALGGTQQEIWLELAGRMGR